MKSDEPWQTLACCMEIAKAVRSSDPAKYISHFPVHQVHILTAKPASITLYNLEDSRFV